MKQTTVENCPHCTKPAGHPGDHVACGLHAHDIISWPQSEPQTPTTQNP